MLYYKCQKSWRKVGSYMNKAEQNILTSLELVKPLLDTKAKSTTLVRNHAKELAWIFEQSEKFGADKHLGFIRRVFHLKEGDKATFAPSVFFDRLAKVISKQKIAKQPKAKTSKDKSNKASVKATKEEPKTEPKTTKASPSLLDIKNAVELYNKNSAKQTGIKISLVIC